LPQEFTGGDGCPPLRHKPISRKEILQVPAPFIQVLGPLTVVVVDQNEFNQNVDKLSGVMNLNGSQRVDEKYIERLKIHGNIPAIGRGSKTEFLFEQYGVETGVLGLVVRGFSKNWVESN
jgi:hypothetical protein